MRQDMTGFWDAVPSAGPYANNLHLAPDRSSLNFYRPDALSDAQSTVSKHWGKLENKQIQTCWPGICVSIAGNFLTLKCRFHFGLCQPRIDCDDGFFIIRRHICTSNMTGRHTRHQSPRVHQLKLTPLLFSTPHTHLFNGPLSRTTRVSRYEKGKTNPDFTEARDSEWQWHQLGHMQVCTLLQTDNHASTPHHSVFTGQMPFLPPNQQRQSTEGIPLI